MIHHEHFKLWIVITMMHLYHEHFKGAWWKSPSERGWWLAYSHCQVPSILYNKLTHNCNKQVNILKIIEDGKFRPSMVAAAWKEPIPGWLHHFLSILKVAIIFVQFWKLPSFLINFENCISFDKYWKFTSFLKISHDFAIIFWLFFLWHGATIWIQLIRLGGTGLLNKWIEKCNNCIQFLN